MTYSISQYPTSITFWHQCFRNRNMDAEVGWLPPYRPYPSECTNERPLEREPKRSNCVHVVTGKANLTGADLRGADLRGADLTSSMRSVVIVAKHSGVAQWLRC